METIKINTSYSEETNTLNYRMFTILTDLPECGSVYKGQEILKVETLTKDPEQGTSEAEDYDCFKLTLKPEEPEDAPDEAFVALSRIERVKFMPVVRIEALPPTSHDANIILTHCVTGSLREEIQDFYEEDNLLHDYFGISDDLYERTVTSEINTSDAMPLSVRNDLIAQCASSRISASTGFGVEIEALVPYWWPHENITYITRDQVHELADQGLFLPRSASDLHPAVVDYIIDGCEDVGENWLEENGYPMEYDLISLDKNEIIEISGLITSICVGPFKDLLRKGGYSQAKFAKRFRIPLRSVEDWASGRTVCRIYLRLMFAELMGLLKRRH